MNTETIKAIEAVQPDHPELEACQNEFLKYAITMAVADGILNNDDFVCKLIKWFEYVDIEQEFKKILRYEAGYGKPTGYNYKKRAAIKSLVSYAKAKEVEAKR